MEIKTIIKLDETEKTVLETAREIIATYCTEFESNSYCKNCPLFEMCNSLKTKLDIDFEGMFSNAVDILTK